ncbi:MAG: MBL fold metallo-hydrolase [Candidatus Brocadiaceae bacterium]|nr:MBL fold metallo-hydrolase [Candidatus Brocadiaceae bacterium]
MSTSAGAMAGVRDYRLADDQAALWPLGQAGFLIRGGGVTVAIDPYLTDSVGKASPAFARAVPSPIEPEDLQVDMFVVTHDHLDHLDPETIGRYRHPASTRFVAPRLACRRLRELGIPSENVLRVDAGDEAELYGIRLRGVYAVPTGPDVLDTCGYRLELPGGKSVYHSSDTAWSDLLERAAPRAQVLLVCINGKYGNLNVHEAVRLTRAVRPDVAVPMHYDLMRLNAENPDTFIHLLRQALPECEGRILKIMEPLVW